MWVVLALLSAILSAVYYLSAQNIKLDANTFMVYRGALVALLLLPVLMFNPAVFPRVFYLMAILQGLIAAVVDYAVFGINQKYGSETVSSITPLSVLIVFVMWCFIDVGLLEQYRQSLWRSVAIVISCLGAVLALNRYHQVAFTRQAFYRLLPLLLLTSAFAVLSKTVMNYAASMPIWGALWQSFIIAAVVGVAHLAIYCKKRLPLKNLMLPQNLLKGLIFIYMIGFLSLKSLAFYYAQNPAYVAVLAYTSLFWVMLLSRGVKAFKFNNNDEQAAAKWKILFLASVLVLILATK
jgi:hypothetical protein